jgi:hypothetical protein
VHAEDSLHVADQSRVEDLHHPALLSRYGGDAQEVAQELPEGHGVRRDAGAAVARVLELDDHSVRRVDDEVELASGQNRHEHLGCHPGRIDVVLAKGLHRLEPRQWSSVSR